MWLTLMAVGLITLATFLAFRSLVYAPLERLLQSIVGMNSNDPMEDEIGRASREYDRMLAQLHNLTEERERQKEVLRERVQDATQELQQRNEQLADANRELWETSRRLSQMERLTVAGQTAAQFAHEVGTPLNTISIHAEMLRKAAENARCEHLKFDEETMRTLVAYNWPGNVCELESAIEYAALHARGEELKPEDLPPELQSLEVRETAERSPRAALFDDLPTLDELERRYLLHVLKAVGGNKTTTASVMGVDRRTLYRMANRFGIKLTDGDTETEPE